MGIETVLARRVSVWQASRGRDSRHGGHPVLRWNMDNAYVRTDPAGNLKIDKQRSTEKVDGAVALVMGLDRAMKNLNGGGSVYDDRGLLII